MTDWLLGTLLATSGLIVRSNAFFDSITFDDFWKRVQPAGEATP